MALIRAFAGALGGTFADQWKDIIIAPQFAEHTAVMAGVLQTANNGRGSNTKASEGIISNGSKIFVPENVAAFIFDQAGIENIIVQPGGYIYQNGEETVFNGDGIGKAIIGTVRERFSFGGQPPANKRIAFINLHEIRGIRFGTPSPLVYNDLFYGTDLEIRARGTLSLKISDPVLFVRNFLPANVTYYSFDDPSARNQILSEFLQSLSVAVNSLSGQFRISQLPSQANDLAQRIAHDSANTGTWRARFGFEIVNIGLESVEFTPESRELVKQFSTNKMNVNAYQDVSQRVSSIAAQQQIARGIQEQGLGDMGAMVFGMNMAQGLGANAETPLVGGQSHTSHEQSNAAVNSAPDLSVNEQIEAVKKLKELVEAGILTQQEFDIKKKAILGL